ncbi:hypothetical protein LshimejAT787_0406890 [Lyophyllum shimeji]|uniref:Uncharacterized protein n=1 Tax=Lyophyllum shimeji TaxID=47721 RepID=A0A9P3PLI3_LYOSH|nr:hypothetical protein LshimejAT787_0406890 [Lyophyllum shimeji]
MEQLRSSNCKPAVSHLRQLIYIALQPEHPPAVNEMVYTDVPSSPGKAAMKMRIPSGPAVLAARRLLRSFVITNAPETIARALPSCGDPRQDRSTPPDDGSLESVIGPQSMCIPNAKNCWSILAHGFTRRGQNLTLTPGESKKRTHNPDEDEDSLDGHTVENAVVGPDAWSVLDWLILLFEQDEMLADACGSGRFSNLLLQQIPYPRSGIGPRWDAETPLRIVFFCLEQADTRRQILGSRLMALLINLSSTAHLDLPIFVASVYGRLTATALEGLPALFSNLSRSPTVHKFKILLCQKFLTDPSHDQTADARPKAHARVQPRALRQARTESSATQNPKSQLARPGASVQSPINPLPGYTEIRRLMETKPSPSAIVSTSLLLRIKFELLNSYGMLQSQTPLTEKDTEWLASLHDGRMIEILDLAFGRADEGGEGGMLRETIQSIRSAW